jgi:uncharacterized ion transporter superfamily protein YfcC
MSEPGNGTGTGTARFPHTFVLLFALVVIAALATHFIPAGAYARATVDGRSVVDPASYERVPPAPAGVAEVVLAYPRGLAATAEIVFFIFIIGGAFGIVNATGSIEAGIGGVVRMCGERSHLVIPVLMFTFALGGGTFGMLEELLPFLPALVVLSKRLGYDAVTGGAIGLVGSGAGFAGAFMNPFTVGVAQGIAGLPLFSGLAFRAVCWLIISSLAVGYVTRYASRVKRMRRAHGNGDGDGDGDADADPQGEGDTAPVALPTPRQKLVLGLLVVAVLGVVLGALRFGWGILELSGLFLAVGVLAGIAGGLGANRTAESFVDGAAGIAMGALVVGLARGVLVIFDGASVTDTILYSLASGVAQLPSQLAVVGVYFVQVLLNFLVPSGSGQAALSIPILAPLGDLVGITRQTSVLAYQFGDGFTNVFTPTQGYFMAGLAIINVRFSEWVRFIWPLQLLWIGAGLVLLLVAHAIQLGPF